MKNNNFNFNIDLKTTLNRCIIMSSYPTGIENPVQFAILHHKQTPALQFQVDTKNRLIKSGDVRVSMHRNLENCDFCNTFFDIENATTDYSDYRGKFAGEKNSYRENLVQFVREKHDFHIPEGNKKSQNYMLILGWKVLAMEDDFNIFFIQRRCYNKTARIHIIRSAVIQFATDRGLNILDRIKSDTENKIRKALKTDNVPDFSNKKPQNETKDIDFS